MSQLKQRTGTRWLAWLACAFLFLLSIIGTSSLSYAQIADEPTRSGGTLEGVDGSEAGDPDMPTGETPPPSGSGSNDTGLSRGHGITSGITEAVPSKRYGQWAHWKIVLKMLARSFYLR